MEIQYEWQIRSAKITGKQTVDIRFVQDSEEDGLPTNKEFQFKCDRVPHTALFSTFRLLLAHAMVIAERIPVGHKIDATYLKARTIHDDPKFIKYEVVGFKLKGNDKGDTIQIEIKQNLNNGSSIPMVLPFVKLYEGSSYEFSGNLADDLESVQQECMDYIGGKYRESQQMSLEFEEEEAF